MTSEQYYYQQNFLRALIRYVGVQVSDLRYRLGYESFFYLISASLQYVDSGTKTIS